MASFKLEGREYPIPESFTLGEMCDMEQHFGVRFSDDGDLGIRGTAAILWVAIRRVDPSVKVDDIRGMDIEVLESFGLEVADQDPPVESGTVNAETSGDGSELSAENLANGQSPIGVPV